MPLRKFKCPLCGAERETFRKAPLCNHNQEEEGEPFDVLSMEEVLVAPGAKFMEPRDPVSKERGKSVLRGANQILKERARNHSRENELDDLIATNTPEVARATGWLRPDGRKKKKIDDI